VLQYYIHVLFNIHTQSKLHMLWVLYNIHIQRMTYDTIVLHHRVLHMIHSLYSIRTQRMNTFSTS